MTTNHEHQQSVYISSCCAGEETQKSKRFDYLFWLPLTVVSILFFLALFGPDFVASHQWLQDMSMTVYHMLHEIWWGVVLGGISIGLLSKVPRQFVGTVLGQGGTVGGLCRATFAGVLLDLCSHGILMVATQLYERGASAGQVVALLIASPWNSLSLTLILIGLVGIEWTLTFIVLSMLIALVSGFIFDRLVERKVLPANDRQIAVPENFAFWKEAGKAFKNTRFDRPLFTEMLWNGIKGSKIVVRWLLIGILLAALLRTFLDVADFEQFFGPTMVGLAVTIGLATILEVCSEGSSPIAADILTRAQAPGNSFAFLMAGVATDYTEIMVLKDTTKSWKFAFFVPLVTLPQVILLAWIMNNWGTI